jgi:5'-nucleotidase/UDP-sugar diphosphatase
MRKINFLIAVILFTALTLSACSSDSVQTVTIFFTSDEHGHLEPEQEGTTSYGGAANLMATLRQEGYDPDSDRSILISGGDMWAGPAISSWFRGASVIEVTNAMGYDMAVLGNHEFDWGEQQLRLNEEAADFPFIAANVIETTSGKPPEYARPYILKDIAGVKTAVIGLAKVDTPAIVLPSSIKNLRFIDYETALRETVPIARSSGAELVIVASHECPDELRKLAPVATELSIPLLTGGHCHSLDNFEQDGVRIISAGAHMKNFARVDITLDVDKGDVLQTKAELFTVAYDPDRDPFVRDAAIDAIVSGWSEKIDKKLGQVIGFTETGVEIDWPLYNLLVDSWLSAYPEADIAISNFGGYREKIPPGDIKLVDIVAVWPFENDLVSVDLTGRQIMDNLDCCGGVVAGITYTESGGHLNVHLKNGDLLDPEAVYRVIVNSYMYEGGEGYLFSKQNPQGRMVGTNFRDPAINWIRSRETSREHPLETLLDAIPREPGRYE